MNIDGSVAFVTGANRGLGDKLVRALFAAGASKVYAAARDPHAVTAPGAVPIALDVTDHAAVEAAAQQAGDVTLVINNAGSNTLANLLDGDFDAYRLEYDTHVLGSLDVSRAFAPTLARNGGGAILNILSGLSWVSFPDVAAYCAAKAAAWSMTNSLRVALAEQNTLVSALHVGYMDTDMVAGLDVDKEDPADIARIAVEGLQKGQLEILADAVSVQIKAGLATSPESLYPQLTKN